jgi:hypothetical protein
MIVKYFYSNEWHLRGDWENPTIYLEAPDSDILVEQNEKMIAVLLEISDDKQDIE